MSGDREGARQRAGATGHANLGAGSVELVHVSKAALHDASDFGAGYTCGMPAGQGLWMPSCSILRRYSPSSRQVGRVKVYSSVDRQHFFPHITSIQMGDRRVVTYERAPR